MINMDGVINLIPEKLLFDGASKCEKKDVKKVKPEIVYTRLFSKEESTAMNLEGETRQLLLTHWNVNGLKSKLSHPFKQFQKYLKSKPFDFILLNETKLSSQTFEKLKIEKNTLWDNTYNQYWAFSVSRKGYSGTTILTKFRPLRVIEGIGIEEFDDEGRTLTLEFATFYLVAVYVPNSGVALARLEKRTNTWDKYFEAHISSLKCDKPVLIVGDLNVSHRPIDVAFPDLCLEVAGFTEQERRNFSDLLKAGWVDMFRDMYPNKRQYTWFAGYGKERNKGNCWRLDYCLADAGFKKSIKDVVIRDDVHGSDHCPVEVYFSPKDLSEIRTKSKLNP